MKIINADLTKIISNRGTFKLELGCGPNAKNDQYFTLDIQSFDGVDVVADLNEKIDLIPDSCVTELYTRHALEHVDNLIGLMEEIHRICTPGAVVSITVPHFSNALAYSDPTHVRFFGVNSMYYFCDSASQPMRKVPDYYSKARFFVEEAKIMFYRLDFLDKVIAPWFERVVNKNMQSKVFYERHLAYAFPAWEIRFCLRVNK